MECHPDGDALIKQKFLCWDGHLSSDLFPAAVQHLQLAQVAHSGLEHNGVLEINLEKTTAILLGSPLVLAGYS